MSRWLEKKELAHRGEVKTLAGRVDIHKRCHSSSMDIKSAGRVIT